MKMILCGKGGSGKSTLTAMLAFEYARRNNRVLVIDTDESNTGLHRLMGMEAPDDLMNFFGGKEGMKERIMAAAPDYASVKLIDSPWNIDTLPSGHVSRKNNVSLVSIGKIHHAGEGCACPMGMLSRQFLKSLSLNPGDVVITDTEAGIEHFGRGVDEEADRILMVVDPSFESVSLANKIATMLDGKNIHLQYILNRVSPEISHSIRENISHPDRIIAEIPVEDQILSMGLTGSPLSHEYPPVRDLVTRLSG